jgi:hypothetical protein
MTLPARGPFPEWTGCGADAVPVKCKMLLDEKLRLSTVRTTALVAVMEGPILGKEGYTTCCVASLCER